MSGGRTTGGGSGIVVVGPGKPPAVPIIRELPVAPLPWLGVAAEHDALCRDAQVTQLLPRLGEVYRANLAGHEVDLVHGRWRQRVGARPRRP